MEIEELFDILDKEGKSLGYTRTRKEAHTQGLWHNSAHLWIINSINQLLLQRRDDCKIIDPNKWDISVAGHVSAGQTIASAMIRETQEELGLKIDESQLKFLFSMKREYTDPSQNIIDREFHNYFVCYRDVNLKHLTLQKGEVKDVCWQDLEEFMTRVNSNDPSLVGRPGEYNEIFHCLGL